MKIQKIILKIRTKLEAALNLKEYGNVIFEFTHGRIQGTILESDQFRPSQSTLRTSGPFNNISLL